MMLAARRRWQSAVPPVDLPPPLRARLDATAGTNLAHRFRREEILSNYRPKLAIALAEDHMAVAGDVRRAYYEPPPAGKSPDLGRWRNSWDDARAHTEGQHRQLGQAQLGKAFDEEKIRDYAENYAGICARAGNSGRAVDFVRSVGATPPTGRRVTPDSALSRMCDPQWWRRQLRVTWNRRAENQFRAMGIVRKGREAYASDDAVQARTAQKARCARFMESHAATNQQGEQLNLLELAEKSLANPALRRGEFMCRVRGFEEVADARGDVAQFWTLTAPSRFHAYLHNGIKNAKHDGADVRDAQKWLCDLWARVRARLKRQSFIVYGFRIAEPHHDATPHWHLLLFVRPADAVGVAKILEGYWTGEEADELGPRDPRTGRRPKQEARCKLITIDRAEGSAVGYIAKYVSKNIDGAGAIGGELDDETAKPVSEGIRRVDAWASMHRIRQFQQIGGPPVGLWRELRRLRDPVEPPTVETVRLPASESSSWAGFIEALGGLERGSRRVGCVAERFSRRLTHVPQVRAPRLAARQWRNKMGPRVAWEMRPATAAEMPAAWLDRAAPRAVDREGREVICATKYGETPADRAAGIVSYGLLGRFQSAATRPHIWRIQKNFARSVMNPPRQAAVGLEAGNRESAVWHDETSGLRAQSIARWAVDGSGVVRPAVPPSFFFSGSGSYSALGPVAITVRGCGCRECTSGDYSRSPYRRVASGAAHQTGPPG